MRAELGLNGRWVNTKYFGGRWVMGLDPMASILHIQYSMDAIAIAIGCGGLGWIGVERPPVRRP